MYRCQKCGTEFEGKFCPECGTALREDRVCPECGSRLEPDVKFCPQCGYSLSGAIPAAAADADGSSRGRPSPLKTVFAFLPASLLLLLSLLLWAFFAAPAAKVNILIATVKENLYLLAGEQVFQGARATVYTLYAAAGSGIVAALVALFLSGRGRKFPAVLSVLFCIADVVLGAVLIVKIQNTGANADACPILIVVFSALFGFVSAVAGVLNARTEPGEPLWERLHLRRWWKDYGELLVLIVLFLGSTALTVATFYGDHLHEIDGTYSISDEGQTLAWIKISGHEWSDSSNQSGTLDRDGDDLIFYTVLFGSKTKIAEGTIHSSTLTLQTIGSDQITYTDETNYSEGDSIFGRGTLIVVTLTFFIGAVVCAFRQPKRFLEVNHQNNNLNDTPSKSDPKNLDPPKS